MLPLSELMPYFMDTDKETSKQLLERIDKFCDLYESASMSSKQSIIYEMITGKRFVSHVIDRLFSESLRKKPCAALHDSRQAVEDIKRLMDEMHHNAMMNNTLQISQGSIA
jgi:hypothetical protein